MNTENTQQTTPEASFSQPAVTVSEPETAAIAKLQQAILSHWGKTERELAPLFYELRLKLKAQGKKGKGFGAWLAEHDIPRATADRWADNHEIRLGLRPAKAPKLELITSHEQNTFPQVRNSSDEPETEEGDGFEIVTGHNVMKFSLILSKEQLDFLQSAEAKLRAVHGTSNASETIFALVTERYKALVGTEVAQ